jgi:phage terminase large subunit-like protein
MSILKLSEQEELELIQLLKAFEQITQEELFVERGKLYKWLFPEHNVTLSPGEFPATHKIFEGVDTIYSRHNYPKTLEFWEKGATYQQRLFRAGNRVGKTLAATLEVVFHTTGLYPSWWCGKRFNTNNDWWVVGVSQKTIIDILQPYFLGKVGEFGTGLIPRECIDFKSLADVTKNTSQVGSVRIKHANGNYSSITFKSFEQGWASFQGTAVSVLMDEEPPVEVYRECLMRTATGGNILILTFTPLQGNSEVIQNWFPDGDVTATGDVGNSRWVTGAAMDDVKHLSPEKIESILAIYPPFQRTARRYGLPTLEEGAIYPVEESTFVVEPFEIPKHWPKAYGFDVGRNTAAVWFAMDRDSGTIYTYSEFFMKEGLPSTHAQAIHARGKWIRGAIDTAARGRSPTDGEDLFRMYTDLGLNIQNADKSVESGLYEMLELLTAGRLKVFNTCQSLLKEFRGYRRDKNGKVVKKDDHIMDAWRYGVYNRDRVLWTEVEAKAALNPEDIIDLSDVMPHNPDSWMLG